MTKQNVLVTGMSGLIGRAVRKQLEERYALRAVNRRPVDGIACHQADISDLSAIQPALQGIEVVVHLAAKADVTATWNEILTHNIIGTYNVFEASRRAGVRRIVYASSGATVGNYERELPYSAIVAGRYGEVGAWAKLTHETPPRPWGLYGASKLWGEALGRHYSDMYGISIICLRIGAVNREDRPLEPRHFSVWCSQRDVAQMVERCIMAPEGVRFDIFYVVSNNTWGYRDLEHARAIVGYEPQDSAEQYR